MKKAVPPRHVPDSVFEIPGKAAYSPAQRLNDPDLEDGFADEWYDRLDEGELEVIHADWRFWARPKQQVPKDPDWQIWVALAGRGWGKTRTGAEWVNKEVREGRYGRFHLVGATASDIRDIMVEGPSGIIETSPSWFQAQYRPTKRRVEWPNGAWALCFSADEPERLRGEQCEAAWADELAAWRYMKQAWEQLMLGLRLGVHPRCLVTTTPKPHEVLKKILNRPGTLITKGTTYENFDNLAQTFTTEIVSQFEGTRFGRQELYAEILDDAPGALWKRDLLDITRVETAPKEMARLIVAVDPATTFGDDSDETGIIVAGRALDHEAYALKDLSGKYKVEEWARLVISTYHAMRADCIVAEKNQGGDMVEHTLKVYDPTVNVKLVHASRSKQTRAEPVSALYEQHRAHHVGYFPELEDQLCSWEPGMPSPDRLDALVWGMTDLLGVSMVVKAVNMHIDKELQTASYWKQLG